MISVAGYSNLQLIHQSPETLVYSARRTRDNEKVILRQLRPEVAAPDLVAQYRKEYELLASIDSPFIIKALDLIEQNNTLILITENLGGESLASMLTRTKIPVREVLKIAIAVVSGLDHLHARNIIHKDINPANIIYNSTNEQVRIIDFGISSELSSSTVRLEPTNTIEGTLTYLAPEQTGRMNRSIDYRADFYALGATLYELLTGRPPFPTQDPLEMVYNHIAATPEAPSQINSAIPLPLSRIIMKLLAKMPEDRYQSTHAIRQDFMRCLEIIDQRGDRQDTDFEVALDDIPEQLNISERLLERERQGKELKDYLAEVAAGGSRIVVCTGEAGIGKSALIRELHKEVARYGGFIAAGKHSLMSPERPYSAVSSAVADLVRQLLVRKDIDLLRRRINEAVEGSAAILVELIPELKLIIGDHKGELESLPAQPIELRNRLIKGLSGLIRAISNEGKPFVISIENLHWIDRASLELFEPLVGNQKIPYLMVIGAYRIRELHAGHETRQAMEALADSAGNAGNRVPITTVKLTSLSPRSIATIISDSFYRPIEETLKFADLVHAKTNGNPLAVREFLSNLNRKEIVRFDRVHREWVWDMALANQQPPTDNVSALLAERIEHLEPVTAHLLKIASCAGDEFDLDTIRNVSKLSFSETSARLLHAVR
ncbi:MAG: AAA family ATPase, partial [Pseudomonadales bacterium]